MSKPKYLECIYTAPIVFDLEELEINWKKVKDHYVKYGADHPQSQKSKEKLR